MQASDSDYAIHATRFRASFYTLMPEETLTDVKCYICLAPTYMGVSAFTDAAKEDNAPEHIYYCNSLISLLFRKIIVDAKAI